MGEKSALPTRDRSSFPQASRWQAKARSANHKPQIAK
jgi:hypothetical protein